MFKRGDRVVVPGGSLGTVVRAKPDLWGYIGVRLDKQQPGERSLSWLASSVSQNHAGTNEYHLRRYSLYNLSHDEIAALRYALEAVNMRNDTLTDDRVQQLLTRLPVLPS